MSRGRLMGRLMYYALADASQDPPKLSTTEAGQDTSRINGLSAASLFSFTVQVVLGS